MAIGEQEARAMIHEVLGDKFIGDDRLSIGAANSGHGVLFGEYGGINVAAKPFTGRRATEKAEHEERMTKLLREFGFLTLTPVGVMSGDEVAILLTEHVSGLMGANALSLETADQDTPQGRRVSETVATIFRLLARVHNTETTAGDPQLRNFCLKIAAPPSQEPRLVDLEKATSHGSASPYFGSALKREMIRGTYSLGIRKYGGVNHNTAVGHLYQTVLEPYADTLDPAIKKRIKLVPIMESAINNFVGERKRAQEGAPDHG